MDNLQSSNPPVPTSAPNRLIFHPFRQDNLTQLTLYDNLLERNLKNAVAWLINFDKSEQPIKAQETDSPWQIALSITYCLEARELFLKHGGFADLVTSIECKTVGSTRCVGAVEALIQAGVASADNNHNYYSWDNRLYDTATVTTALIMAVDQLGDHLLQHNATRLQKATEVAQGGINWICSRLDSNDAFKTLDFHTNGTFRPILHLLTLVAQSQKPEWKAVLQKWNRVLKQPPIEAAINIVLSRSYREKPETGIGGGMIRFDTDQIDSVHTLALYHNISSTNKSELATEALSDGIKILETRLAQKIGYHPSHASALSAYIRANHALGVFERQTKSTDSDRQASSNDFLILAILAYQVDPSEVFENGSVFHDIYATLYYLDSLIVLLQFWPATKKPVIQLYNDVLHLATHESRMSDERNQIYALQYRQQQLLQNLRDVRRREASYHLISATVLTLLLIALLWILLFNILASNIEAFIGAFTFGLAGLLSALAWYWRRIQKWYNNT